MEVPQGSKFIYVSVPLILLSVIMITYYVDKSKDSVNASLTDQELDNISQGKDMNDFEELKYEVTREGNGPTAGIGDTVVVNYEGTLINGTKFDSSYDRNRPFEFTLGQYRVIEGWEEGIKGMKVGEERILRIPSDMAYGPDDYGPIPGGSGLVFRVELLEIK